MYFVIADIPLYLVGLPFGFIPRPKNDASGFLVPEYGEDARRGFYLRNGGYYFAVNDYLNTAVRGGLYSYGSWELNTETNFKKRYKYSGNLSLRYTKDKEGEEETPGYREVTSFSINGSYNQDAKANPYQTFSASVNYNASQDHEYAARDLTEGVTTTRSSSISYRRSRPGGRFNLTASINASQNTRLKETNLSLPVIVLNMNRWQPAKNVSGKKLLFVKNFNVGFNSNFKNSVSIADTLLFTKEALYEMRNGFKYDVPISTSFKMLKFINVSPSFSYTGRIYSNYVEKHLVFLPDSKGELQEEVASDTIQGFRHPFDFSFSVPFSTKIFGIYKGKGKRQSALRHVLTPSISYNYRPDFSAEKWGYYSYYREDADPTSLYSYYDIGVYGKPPAGESGAIGLGLTNNFELKTKTKRDTAEESFTKIKIIDNFNINTSYNLAADSMNWSMINIRANTRLTDILSVSYSSSYDPYARDTTGARTPELEWDVNRKVARLSNLRLSINGTFKSKQGNKGDLTTATAKKSSEVVPTPMLPGLYAYPEVDYVDLDAPWSLTFGYTFNITNQFNESLQEYVLKPTQTLNLNGTLNLTSNWRLTARADYDFKMSELTNVNMSVYRDLHCWEMSFAATPFGQYKSYTFRINIKSTLFEGLEYKKEKSRYENNF